MNIKKFLKVPSPYTVLVLFIVVAAIATWVFPAGKYNSLSYSTDSKQFSISTQEGTSSLEATQQSLENLGISIPVEKFIEGDIYKPIAIPNTYVKTEGHPQGPVEIAKAPIEGIYEAMDIILFVLIIGGFIGVFRATGMFEAGVDWLSEKLKGRESLLIVIVTSLIAIGGTTFGMAEETLAFYPILVPVFLAAGYDALIPVAALYGGSTIGTMFSSVNPFAVIIASDSAGVNWMNGIEFRLIGLVLGTIIIILYILRYANKVKKDPTKSMLYGIEVNPPAAAQSIKAKEKVEKMTPKLWLLACLFALSFIIMIIGVTSLHWWFLEMTTLFLVAAVIAGFIFRKGEKTFIDAFLRGAEEMLGVAFIIGIARGINIVLNNGQISDSLLYYASNLVSGMPAIAFVIALLIIFIFLTFFISSSSGLAVLTMPIIGPLARVVKVPTEQVVNAYLMGFGIMTFITPTGLILPSLVMVDVSFGKWLKFIFPLLLILTAFASIFLIVGTIF